MSDITSDVQPTDELVKWSCGSAAWVLCPGDRPWFYISETPPIENPFIWDYVCFCPKHCEIKLRRITCQNQEDFLYLGQCKSCHRIYWCYVDVDENKNQELKYD